METYLIVAVSGAAGVVLGVGGLWWLNQQAQTLEVRLYNALSKSATRLAHLQIDQKAAATADANKAAVEAAKASAKANIASL